MIRRVQNIYYMLAYAFQVLHEKGYRDVSSEEFENGLELLAAILCRGVSIQIKRGLTRQYLTQEEALSTPRGKIEINASIRTLTVRKKQLVCTHDEFSVDAYPNRIIKTTLSVLLRSNLSRPRKKELRKLLIFFDGVTPLDIHTINWNIPYNRNNQTYRMILAVCQMLLKGMLQTEASGTVRMMEYLDDQSMARLYEKFILGYYQREHPELKVYAPQIKWAVTNGYDFQLPTMQTDIVLSGRNSGKTLIIDAKYYSHNMQIKAPYMTRTIHSANLYQIFAYVKNWPTTPNESVAGMLLYAGTDDEVQPNNDYQISGNTISVETLDLDRDFIDIANRLDTIAAKVESPGESGRYRKNVI